MSEQEIVRKATGILLIGLSASAYSNGIAMLLLANDSTNIEDYKRRSDIALITNGLFGLIFGLGILFITS